MKAVIQRVASASVSVEHQVIAEIDAGLLVDRKSTRLNSSHT